MLTGVMKAVLASTALLSFGAAKADSFFLNYEAPGVQGTTAGFTVVGVETFDTRASFTPFATNFGLGSAVTAQYSSTQIIAADQYGGAGGVGKYPVAFSNTPYQLTFSVDPAIFPSGINYFGYWLSALDGGNQVEFYRAGTLVGSLSPGAVLSAIGSNPAYFGNPNASFSGQNGGEPYAFINFYDTNGSFDEVRFFEFNSGGGYESDNHTVGYYTSIGGVPEPESWALMIAGFGMIGAAARRRRTVVTA